MGKLSALGPALGFRLCHEERLPVPRKNQLGWDLARPPHEDGAEHEHPRDQVRTLVDTADPPARWFVLNAEAVDDIDSTAIDMLSALQRELAERGIVFGVARAKGMLCDIFDSTGLTERIGSENLFPSVRSAVQAFEERA